MIQKWPFDVGATKRDRALGVGSWSGKRWVVRRYVRAPVIDANLIRKSEYISWIAIAGGGIRWVVDVYNIHQMSFTSPIIVILTIYAMRSTCRSRAFDVYARSGVSIRTAIGVFSLGALMIDVDIIARKVGEATTREVGSVR